MNIINQTTYHPRSNACHLWSARAAIAPRPRLVRGRPACGRAPRARRSPRPRAAARPACAFDHPRGDVADPETRRLASWWPTMPTRRRPCAYPPGEAGSWAQAEIAIEWEYRGGRTFEKQMTDAFGGSAVGPSGCARRQSRRRPRHTAKEGVLSITHGTALITITLPLREDSEAKATAIGKKVLERLGGSVTVAAKQARGRAGRKKRPAKPAALRGGAGAPSSGQARDPRRATSRTR